MKNRYFRAVILAAIFGLFAPDATAEKSAQIDTAAFAERLVALAHTGRDVDLESAVSALVAREDLEPAWREAVIHAFLVGLRTLPPGRIPVPVVERFADYRMQALVPHPESGGTLLVPLYDISGAARGTLAWRDHELRVSAAVELLQTDAAGFWLSAAKGGTGIRVLTDALDRADVGLLESARAALPKAMPGQRGPMPAIAVLATRLRDADLALSVVNGADAATARQVLASAQSFGAGNAFRLVRAASRRQELASEAMLVAAALAPDESRTRSWLLARLDDPERGASAATALARLRDPALDARIVDELRPELAGPALRHRLLYLHLADTPATRDALVRFAGNPAFPAALREEVKRWQ